MDPLIRLHFRIYGPDFLKHLPMILCFKAFTGSQRHHFNKTDVHRQLLCQKRHLLPVPVSFHGYTIDFYRHRALSRHPYARHNPVNTIHSREMTIIFPVHRIQTDIDTIHARRSQRAKLLRQKNTVGCQRHPFNARQPL